METCGLSLRVSDALMAILVVLMLVTTAGTASADPQPSPTATSAPSLGSVTLTATTASSSVAVGGLIIIEGTLTDQDGGPVDGARIKVMLDDKESPDSLVMTDEGGAFQTFAEVPSQRSSGEAALLVTFAGNSDYEAAAQEIGLRVEDIPVVDRTAAEEVTPFEMADASPSVDRSAVDESSAEAVDDSEDRDRSPLSWFYVALVVVGGASLLVTAGLVVRKIYGRGGERVPRRAGSLDMLLDQASEQADESDGRPTNTR